MSSTKQISYLGIVSPAGHLPENEVGKIACYMACEPVGEANPFPLNRDQEERRFNLKNSRAVMRGGGYNEK